MPSFIVALNGSPVKEIEATGNLNALLLFLKLKELPEFPIHVHEGVLYANVGGLIYSIFDSEDSPDLRFLYKQEIKKQPVTKRPKIITAVKALFNSTSTDIYIGKAIAHVL